MKKLTLFLFALVLVAGETGGTHPLAGNGGVKGLTLADGGSNGGRGGRLAQGGGGSTGGHGLLNAQAGGGSKGLRLAGEAGVKGILLASADGGSAGTRG